MVLESLRTILSVPPSLNEEVLVSFSLLLLEGGDLIPLRHLPLLTPPSDVSLAWAASPTEN